MTIDIASLGAAADGKKENREIIQKAIDVCSANGGGRVIIPAGVFKTGSIELKSNVELHLECGAVLLASEDLDNYNADDAFPQNSSSQTEGWNGKHLIYSVGQKNIAITGCGTIDGNGSAFFGENKPNQTVDFAWPYGWRGPKDPVRLRPGQLISINECEHIHIENVTLQNATCWSLLFYGCDHITVHGLHIFNPADCLNTDGIDIDTCRFVTVSDCIILTGDDAIAVRGNGKRLTDTAGRACEFVTITNCVLRSSACAVRIGVGTFPIRHIRISQLVIQRAGVGVCFCPEWVASRGTPLNDIAVTGITAENLGYVTMLKVFYGTPATDLRLSDVTATAEKAFLLQASENAEADIAISDLRVREIPDYAYGENTSRHSSEPFACLQNVQATFSGVTLEKIDRHTVLDLAENDGITVYERK